MLLSHKQIKQDEAVRLPTCIFPTGIKICDVIAKEKKSPADIRVASEFFKQFAIPEQLKIRNTNYFKEFLDCLECSTYQYGSIVYDSQTYNEKKLWYIVSGEIVVENRIAGQCVKITKDVTLSERCAFGYEGCGEQEQWENYMVTTSMMTVLLSIEHSKLAKFLSSDQTTNEIVKGNFICESLGIGSDTSAVKGLMRKFITKLYNKDATIIEEGEWQDNFMLIRRGIVRLLKNIPRQKRNHKIKTAIISDGSFINDLNFLQSCNGKAQYGAQTQSAVELYVIPKSELSKYFQQIPDLQQKLIHIAKLKMILRDQMTSHVLDNQLQTEELHEVKNYVSPPILKKDILSNRRDKENDFIGPIKYQQIVNSEEKVWGPLNECNKKHGQKNKFKTEDLNKILKEEKMNKLMVRQLINKRIKGIQDKDINIELKPTIFQQKSTKVLVDEYQDTGSKSQFDEKSRPMSAQHVSVPQPSEMYSPLGNADTGLINHMSKNLLDYKKNVLCLRPYNRHKQRLGSRISCDLSRILRERMKPKVYYQYVKAPRKDFQCTLNSPFDTLIFSQSSSGKQIRKRVRLA